MKSYKNLSPQIVNTIKYDQARKDLSQKLKKLPGIDDADPEYYEDDPALRFQ